MKTLKEFLDESKKLVGQRVAIHQPGTSMHGRVGKVTWSNAAGSHHEVELDKHNTHSFKTDQLKTYDEVDKMTGRDR